jgi:hypothetical protein
MKNVHLTWLMPVVVFIVDIIKTYMEENVMLQIAGMIR